jgi:L-iditol 2-dehydrogenase
LKALQKVGRGKGLIEVREVEKPTIPAPDWVLIKVKAAGVCGTDLHIWHDEFTYWPPVTLGHEFAGVIEEMGSAVTGFNVGDRVVAEPHSKACGVCENCRQGNVQICVHKRSPGWGMDGAFTDYVVMPYHLLHKIPDNVSDEVAALAEPFAIGVHEVLERGKIAFQDFVVVSGSGPIGIIAGFLAKAAGAGTVVMTGLDAGEYCRFGVAKDLGVDRIINVQRENVVDVVMEMTNGRGADIVIETSGAGPAIGTCVDLLRKCGRICAIGIPGPDTIPFPWKSAIYKRIDIVFNMSSYYTAWDRALSVMSTTKADLSKLITHRVSIDAWEDTFNDLIAEKGIKAMFIPESEQ